MTGKLIGAFLIIIGCGGFGCALSAACKREESLLRQLIAALDFMQCELQFRMTPLPDLCRKVGKEHRGEIGVFFRSLAEELDNQISPDVYSCINAVLGRSDKLPGRVITVIELLGNTLGRFDAEGQLQALEHARAFCRTEVEEMSVNRDVRLRSYQALGLCAGAALAILFV